MGSIPSAIISRYKAMGICFPNGSNGLVSVCIRSINLFIYIQSIFRQLQSNKFEHLLLKMKQSEDANDDHLDHEEKSESSSSDYQSDSDQENKGDAKNQKSNRLSPKKQLLSSISPESNKVIIVERSALSAIGIFAKNLLETELMTEWEYSLLERFYSMIAWEAMHILYLQTDPQICCKRIKQRNRDGEGNLDPVLMQRLHSKHEDMFNTKGVGEAQNIVIVDGSKSSEKVLREALRKISELEIPSKKVCGTIDCCV